MSNEQETNTTETQAEQTSQSKGDKFLWLVLLLIIGVFSWIGWKQHTILHTLLVSYDTYNDNASRLAKWPEHMSHLETQVQKQQQTINDLQAQVAMLRKKIEHSRATTPTKLTMLLSEAHSLTRLAEQKLWLTQDITTAQNLLKKADSLIAELNDTRFRKVRSALAADIQTLNQIPMLDREGLILALKAISKSVMDARLHTVENMRHPATTTAQPTHTKTTTDTNWKAHMYTRWEEFKTQFIRIQYQDTQAQPLFLEDSAQRVKDNINSLLIQAQLAVGTGDQKTYHSSLTEVVHLFAKYVTQQVPTFSATQTQLTQLVELPVTQSQIPELRAAHLIHSALQQVLEQNQQQG